jgi:glycosyltransferase involved in cell wall biosynthesis
VVPLGFDLAPFSITGADRAARRTAARAELGIPATSTVVTLIARLVPIKRVDRFLRVCDALRDVPSVRFLIVGDGELRQALQESSEAQQLRDRLIWAGFRRDMPAVFFASDVVVQTSDNEGTPVSLIESQAAGVPVVSTRVGGTATVLADARFLAAVDDERQLISSVRMLLEDQNLALSAAATGRNHVLQRFTLERLVADMDRTYRVWLAPKHSQQ